MTRTGEPGALLFLRHGQSVSNAADVFTGWSDAPLTDLGADQVERLDIPTAVPMRYRLDRLRHPIVEPGGRYLDPIGAGEPVRIGRYA